jgi:cytochrome c oxidase subunit 3
MNERVIDDQQYKVRKYKAETMLVWLLTFSVIMVFAALTSAYIIRKEAKDWLVFNLPEIYFISTAILIASSVFMIFVMNSVKENKIKAAKIYMLIAILLGIAFCFTQYHGFFKVHEQGIFSLGLHANIAASFLYALVITHIGHLILAIGGMIWTFIKLSKGAYSPKDFHGLKLCSLFWHFMDFLWVYLFLFLFFIR